MSRHTPQKSNQALRVPKDEAEAALDEVSSRGLLDRRRKVLDKGNFVEIPVTGPLPGRSTAVQEEPVFYRRTPDLAEILGGEITEGEAAFLPRGWFILGDVIIVKIAPEIEGRKARIGEALLDIYPRCRSVLRDFGISGELREPVREIIAGEGSETVHRENGVLFKLDARRIMFSQGNLRERIRMGRLGKGEVVVDMFAGIGYFTLPMAVHSRPERITAIELNPTAYSYLAENIRLNRVEDIVEPVLGDCREEAPEGEADRVLMGYVGTTDRYLKAGISALRKGGIIHYHQTLPSWLYPGLLLDDIKSEAEALGRRAEILGWTRIKKYSPGVLHAVVDARIE